MLATVVKLVLENDQSLALPPARALIMPSYVVIAPRSGHISIPGRPRYHGDDKGGNGRSRVANMCLIRSLILCVLVFSNTYGIDLFKPRYLRSISRYRPLPGSILPMY